MLSPASTSSMSSVSQLPDKSDVPPPHILTSRMQEETACQLSETSPLLQREEPITYSEAMSELIKLFAPYSLSRLVMVMSGIGKGMVLRNLSRDEIAGALLADALIYEVMSTVQGTLRSTGTFVGELNGEQRYSQIGKVVNQSWLVGVGLSLSAGAILLHASSILAVVDIPDQVARAAQAYCSAYSYGILPISLLTSDIQFALGTEQPRIILMSESTCSGLTILLGYSLALGVFGLPRLGITGLGYGSSLAAWLSFIGLRLYYKFSGQYGHFNLFDSNFPKLEELKKFFKLGLPVGLKNAIEAANAMILSLLASKLGKEVLIAAQASAPPTNAFETMLRGLAQAIRSKITNGTGQLAQAIREHDAHASIEILQQNIRRLGHAGLIIGFCIASATCLLFTGLSKQISETFIDASHDIAKETLQLAQTLLSINGVGILIDAIRNISASNLQGLQDVSFASLLSVVAMTIVGLPIGAYLSLQLDKGAEWLFIARHLGSFAAAVGISYRWFQKSNSDENMNNIVVRLA